MMKHQQQSIKEPHRPKPSIVKNEALIYGPVASAFLIRFEVRVFKIAKKKEKHWI